MRSDGASATHDRMSFVAQDPVRKLIARLIDERGLTLKALSQQMGKADTYMQQYLNRGLPRELKERERGRLAELLGIDESQIGGPNKVGARTSGADQVEVNQYDVQAGAGSPVLIEEEEKIGTWTFPKGYIRHSLGLRPDNLALIQVKGDSMEPTLRAGDLVMVDLSDKATSQPGIFALYDGEGAVVKRVEKIPTSSPPKVRLISDNPRHSAYDVDPELINIAGRVVWLGRRL